MCGRFVRDSSIPEIAKEFNTDEPSFDMDPSYNVAPAQGIIIVINDKTNKLVTCTWGFIPSWAKDASTGHKMINARAETIADKPSFRSSVKNKRCLVVANGFYEWKKDGKVKKPFYVRLKSGSPFGFAGLYSVWHSPDGNDVRTSLIITTGSNELIAPIHDRMPVIIPVKYRSLWLDRDMQDSKRLLSLMKPYDPYELIAFEVSPRVNSPAYNSSENIRPLSK